jgi:hypothetical protein
MRIFEKWIADFGANEKKPFSENSEHDVLKCQLQEGIHEPPIGR